MQRRIISTADGSHSVSIPEMNVTYHSVHGAIQESLHVFIEAGYRSGRSTLMSTTSLHDRPDRYNTPAQYILEMGFGTGLNALLTLIESHKQNEPIHYTAIELYPLTIEEVKELNYCSQLNQPEFQTHFEKMHQCDWEKDVAITPLFTLHKTKSDLTHFSSEQLFNIIYFDAFAPTAQPELWTVDVFKKMYSVLSPGGILVTYCSKGDVRRAMQAAGFTIEKIPGPPGKREMVRARK